MRKGWCSQLVCHRCSGQIDVYWDWIWDGFPCCSPLEMWLINACTWTVKRSSDGSRYQFKFHNPITKALTNGSNLSTDNIRILYAHILGMRFHLIHLICVLLPFFLVLCHQDRFKLDLQASLTFMIIIYRRYTVMLSCCPLPIAIPWTDNEWFVCLIFSIWLNFEGQILTQWSSNNSELVILGNKRICHYKQRLHHFTTDFQ